MPLEDNECDGRIEYDEFADELEVVVDKYQDIMGGDRYWSDAHIQ